LCTPNKEEYPVCEWEEVWTMISISSRAALLICVSALNALLAFGLHWRGILCGLAATIAGVTVLVTPVLLKESNSSVHARGKGRPMRMKLQRIFESFEFYVVVTGSITANVLFEFLGFSKLFMRRKFHVTDDVASSAPTLFLLGQMISLIVCAYRRQAVQGGMFIIGSFCFGCVGLLAFCALSHAELEPSPLTKLAPVDTILVRDDLFLLDRDVVEANVVLLRYHSIIAMPAAFIFGFGLAPAMLLPSALWITHFGREDDTALLVGLIDAIGYLSAAVFDRMVGSWRTRAGDISDAWALIFDFMMLNAVTMFASLWTLFFHAHATLRRPRPVKIKAFEEMRNICVSEEG